MSQPASSATVLARPSGNPVSRVRRWRLAVERLSIYMPAALMAMLALGSYWLLRSTPPAPEPVAERPLLHDPSDVMRRFSVRTHGLDGQLKSELLGQEARRFEDNGSMEVDQPRMRWFSPQGVLTTAQADLVRTNAERDDYLLRGHAVVVRNAAQLPDGQRLERLEFQGEHLRILTKEERVVSDQPVLLVRGRNRITAGSLDWSERDRVANLRGRVQAVLPGRQPP